MGRCLRRRRHNYAMALGKVCGTVYTLGFGQRSVTSAHVNSIVAIFELWFGDETEIEMRKKKCRTPRTKTTCWSTSCLPAPRTCLVFSKVSVNLVSPSLSCLVKWQPCLGHILSKRGSPGTWDAAGACEQSVRRLTMSGEDVEMVRARESADDVKLAGSDRSPVEFQR